MTPAESKRLYLHVFTEMSKKDHDAAQWREIHREMTAVVRAADVEAAVQALSLYQWPTTEAMLADVRKLRRTAKRWGLKT